MLTAKLIDLLNERYDKLTKSEKKIANFLYHNLAEAQYMSITSLAETCMVAESTIFRFCKSLGFEGYNEFKLSIAKSFSQMENLHPGDGTVFSYENQAYTNSFEERCKNLYSVENAALAQTLECTEEKSVKQAVEILCAARRAYCLGQGGSLGIAMSAWSRFVAISPNFFCVEDSHLQAVTTSLLTCEDAILLFSYSGSTKDMLDILPTAHKNGVKIILVTHYKNSPAAAYADVVLLCGSNEGPLQLGSVAAKIAQLFVIDILFNEFWRKNPEQSAQNNEATSSATTRKLL